jgi:hypothetical protein
MTDQDIAEACCVVLAGMLEHLLETAREAEGLNGWIGATWLGDQCERALGDARMPALREGAVIVAKRALRENEQAQRVRGSGLVAVPRVEG